MNPDEEAEEALKDAYGKALSENLTEFQLRLPAALSLDAVAALFRHYASWPAYSVWRGLALERNGAAARGQEPRDFVPSNVSQAEPRLRAAQIKGGESATKAEWARMIAWAKGHGNRRLKGDDGRWNLSEEELQEALR